MSVATAEKNPDAPTPRRASPSGGRRRARWLVSVVLVLAGIFVLLYPVLATQYNNAKQREFSDQYNNQVESAAPDALAGELERAHAYNETLSGVPILDPYLTRVSEPDESGPYEQYLGVLARFDAMARVRVPSADINLPVYHGTNDDVIAKGAGHLYGTSLPVGGAGTHAVLTSHTGMTNATLFDHLTDVREGDLMYVDVYGQTLAYQVDTIKVVLPTEIDDLDVVQGADLLTLFTCTPYAVNTHRLLVTGHRVPYDPTLMHSQDEPAVSVFNLEPWMIGLLIGALLAVALVVSIAVREGRLRALARDQASHGIRQ